jgi:hypothetical protein
MRLSRSAMLPRMWLRLEASTPISSARRTSTGARVVALFDARGGAGQRFQRRVMFRATMTLPMMDNTTLSAASTNKVFRRRSKAASAPASERLQHRHDARVVLTSGITSAW